MLLPKRTRPPERHRDECSPVGRAQRAQGHAFGDVPLSRTRINDGLWPVREALEAFICITCIPGAPLAGSGGGREQTESQPAIAPQRTRIVGPRGANGKLTRLTAYLERGGPRHASMTPGALTCFGQAHTQIPGPLGCTRPPGAWAARTLPSREAENHKNSQRALANDKLEQTSLRTRLLSTARRERAMGNITRISHDLAEEAPRV